MSGRGRDSRVIPASGMIRAAMFTQEQKNKIADVLNAKKLNACPSCGKLATFGIGDALVMFTLQENPGRIALGGQSYPCIPLLCSYCGFMMFYNAYVLGLAEFLGVAPPIPTAQEAGTNG
jgi:hypothetical protein